MGFNLNRALVLLGGLICALSIVPTRVPLDMGAPLFVGLAASLVLAFYAPAWMYLVAAFLVAAFPLLVIFVFGAYNGIIHPGTGWEGIGLTMMLLGAVLGLIGGIAGFIEARRQAPAPLASLGRAPQGVIALVAIALIAGVGVSNMWATEDLVTAAEAPGDIIESPDATIPLYASATQFAPRSLSMNASELTVLAIENRDPIVHTFSYVLNGKTHTTVLPAETATQLVFKFDSSREIHFFCEPHVMGPEDRDAESMWGTLTVA